MLPSGKFSTFALAVAAALTALLVWVIEGIRSPAASLLYSDLVQTGIVLFAAYCALHVALRSSSYLRQLWALLTVALFMAGAAQGLETYFQNIPHLSAVEPWPSDILFVLWVIPAVMMFLPRPVEESGAIDWQHALDLAQVVVLGLTAYLYFFYVPSRWGAEGPKMIVKVIQLQTSRDAILGAAFAAWTVKAAAPALRAFFGRMSIFFLLASASEFAYFFTSRVTSSKTGWNDILWCAPYLFVAVVAATWKREDQVVPAAAPRKPSAAALSHLLPIAVPLLVLFMVWRIAREEITLAWFAVAASFVVFAVRLIVANENQRRMAVHLIKTQTNLKRSENMFSSAFRLSPDPVGISTVPGGRFVEVNDSFTKFTGYTREEALHKSPHEMNLWADLEHRTKVLGALQEEGEVREEEFLCRTKSGEIRVGQFSGTLIELDGRAHALGLVRDVTARKRAEEALHQLSTRLLQLQDEERRRIARELHDSLAQSVLAVNLHLAQVTHAGSTVDAAARLALSKARGVLQEMSREIRTLSYLLHPPVLDELGLVSALREYAKGFAERSGIRLEVDLQADFRRLSQEAETALFRIVQESLSNIQRHSGSATAKIHLREESGCVKLEVSDQGCGMNKVAPPFGRTAGTRLGVGILGMRERIVQLGGKMDVESNSSGTKVRAIIPVNVEVADATPHLSGG